MIDSLVINTEGITHAGLVDNSTAAAGQHNQKAIEFSKVMHGRQLTDVPIQVGSPVGLEPHHPSMVQQRRRVASGKHEGKHVIVIAYRKDFAAPGIKSIRGLKRLKL